MKFSLHTHRSHYLPACLSSPLLSVHLMSQGFLDIDLTDLRKGGANITGFQLVNNSEPSVSRVVQQWMEFDNKDSKMPKSGLKVRPLSPPICPPSLLLKATQDMLRVPLSYSE